MKRILLIAATGICCGLMAAFLNGCAAAPEPKDYLIPILIPAQGPDGQVRAWTTQRLGTRQDAEQVAAILIRREAEDAAKVKADEEKAKADEERIKKLAGELAEKMVKDRAAKPLTPRVKGKLIVLDDGTRIRIPDLPSTTASK